MAIPYITKGLKIFAYSVYSDLTCKLTFYLARVCWAFCFYLIVMINVERCVVLKWPLRSRMYVTEANAKKIVFGVFLFAMILLAVILIGGGRRDGMLYFWGRISISFLDCSNYHSIFLCFPRSPKFYQFGCVFNTININ